MATSPQRPADGRGGRAAPLAMLALPLVGSACLLLVASLRAGVPDWWLERGLISTNAPVATNDFAAANLGQLKHAASLAAEELEANLPGGAGSNILDMVAAWTNATGADDFAAANLGQLKATAKPFYDRIIASGGWTNGYPWTTNTVADDADFAAATIGQLKFAFAFEALSGGDPDDADADGMADAWERALADSDPDDGIAGIADVLPGDDFDGNGISNLTEYRLSLGLGVRWALDETFGTSAADSSGNGNAGALVNGPLWTNGVDGGSVAFDGADDAVVAAHAASLNPTGAVTLSCWIRVEDIPSGYSAIAGMASTHMLHLDERSGTTYRIDPLVWIGGTHAYWPSAAATDLVYGAWYHVAGVYDGAEIRAYVDGAQVGAQARSGAIDETSADFAVGHDNRYGSGERHFQGAVDDMRVYGRALSAEEIAALASPPPPIPTRGLLLWLRPGEGVTTNAAGAISGWEDASAAGNDAAQGVEGLMPVLSTNGATYPPAEFDGADDFLALGPASADFAEGFDAFAVAWPTGDGATRPIIELGDGPSGDRLAFGQDQSTNALAYGVVLASGATGLVAASLPVFADRLQLLEAEQSASGAVRLRQSTVVVASTNAVPVPAAGPMATNWIGAGTAEGSTNYAGGLTELIVYNRRLNAAERDRVQRYLRDRHSPGDSDWDGIPDALDPSPYTWDGDANGTPDFQEEVEDTAGVIGLVVYTPMER